MAYFLVTSPSAPRKFEIVGPTDRVPLNVIREVAYDNESQPILDPNAYILKRGPNAEIVGAEIWTKYQSKPQKDRHIVKPSYPKAKKAVQWKVNQDTLAKAQTLDDLKAIISYLLSKVDCDGQ